MRYTDTKHIIVITILIFTINTLGEILGLSEAAERIHLKFWTHVRLQEEREFIEALVSRFNEQQTDIFIEMIRIPEGDYHEQIEAAGQSGELPDILDFDGPNLSYYAWAGYIIPLNSFLSPNMKNDFLPSIIAQGTYKGKIYGLGIADSGLSIWGNKAYLEKAGVRIPNHPEDAWTGEEFSDVLEKLQALKEVEYALDLKMNYGKGEWFTYGFSPLIQSYGGDLIDRTTYRSAAGVLNGAEAVRAMTEFQRWFRKGYVNPNQTTDTDFPEGKSVLSWVGNWMWLPYRESLGEDLILLPMPKFGKKAATGMGTWVWGITANCQYPEAAWTFLSYWLAPEQIVQASQFFGSPPSRKSALPKMELYKEGGPLHIYIQQLETIAIPRPVSPVYPVITKAFAEAVDRIRQGADVQAELDNAVEAIDSGIRELLRDE